MASIARPASVTQAEIERAFVLADTVLYRDAIDFVRENCAQELPKTSQVQGLLQYSNSWSDLNDYVKHQVSRTEHRDRNFYVALQKWLKAFEGRLDTEFQLIPSDAVKAVKGETKIFFGGLLGREFIQHLVAELRFQSAQLEAGRY